MHTVRFSNKQQALYVDQNVDEKRKRSISVALLVATKISGLFNGENTQNISQNTQWEKQLGLFKSKLMMSMYLCTSLSQYPGPIA